MIQSEVKQFETLILRISKSEGACDTPGCGFDNQSLEFVNLFVEKERDSLSFRFKSLYEVIRDCNIVIGELKEREVR